MSTLAPGPVLVAAPILSCERAGAYRVMWVRAPEIAATFTPGQFVAIAPEPGSAHLLRRPFSIYRADAGTIGIAFDAIGPVTRWFGSCDPGVVLDVVGPLGRGFDLDVAGPALLVGGGYGTAALVALAQRLDERDVQIHAIVGARDAGRVFTDDKLNELCASIAVMTDDGSAGARGIVTDPMASLIARMGVQTVFACGPNAMLKAVGRAAESAGVAAQLAVEEFMACGIGVCWTCVMPVRVGGVVKHQRTCTEGPVFEGASLAWT